MNRWLSVSLLLLMSSCSILLPQSSGPPRNAQVVNMVGYGKELLKGKRYQQAAIIFDEAAKKDFNQSTTAAIYLAGLSHFYNNNFIEAEQRFSTLIEEYDKSKYVEEARYHKALILLSAKAFEEKREGLDQLFRMQSLTRDRSFKGDIDNQVKAFLFEKGSLDFLSKYYNWVKPENKKVVLEALVSRLVNEGRGQEAKRLYDNFLNEGESSNFLSAYFEQGVETINENIERQTQFRIGVLLPFFYQKDLNYYSKEVPRNSKQGLEFYEGFNLALKEQQLSDDKQIFVSVRDTRKDTLFTFFELNKLKVIKPDLVVGGFDSLSTQMISKWAEENKVPYMVPRLPYDEIVSEKNYTFLVHPSIETQGAKMADFVFDSLRVGDTAEVRRVLVWTDGNRNTESIAKGFVERFIELGAEANPIKVSSDFWDEDVQKEVVELVESMVDENYDAWYLPFTSNEEMAGIILAQLGKIQEPGQRIKVFGSPQWWTTYNAIDQELKESFSLVFSSSHFLLSDDTLYKEFYNSYLKEYKMPPERFTIEGYDLGRYVVQLIDSFDNRKSSLVRHIKNFGRFHGMHTDYEFQNQLINQHVNLGRFENGSAVKLNRYPLSDTYMDNLFERGEGMKEER